MSAPERMAREKFWTAWLKALGQDLGARLAETIGQAPSGRWWVTSLVNTAIALEAALAAPDSIVEERW